MSNCAQITGFLKRIVAASLATSFAVASGCVGAPELLTSAVAQPTGTTSGGLSAIDTTRAVSMTVHKLVNPASLGDPATGLQQDVSPQAPVYLNGITFKATLLDTSNMTQTVNGRTFNQLTPDEVASLTGQQYLAYGAKPTDKVFSGETSGNKALTLTGMPQGIYLVEEIVPFGITLWASNGQSYYSDTVKPAEPFIVSLPMLTPSKDGWIYDVNVYPKNSAFRLTKRVRDANAQSGGVITYLLDNEIPVPTASPTDYINQFQISDTFRGTHFPDHAARVVGLEVRTPAGELNFALNPDDYTVEYGLYSFVVSLTQSGLQKIKGLPTGSMLRVTATGQLMDGASFDGTVPLGNIFSGIVGFASEREAQTAASDEVRTYFANIIVHKFSSGTSAGLEGATFELWQCEDPNEDGVWTATSGTSAISVSGQTSWKTGPDGNVKISGVHVEDFADNAPRTGYHYCLKETASPSGFVQLTNLIPISVKSTDSDVDTSTPALDVMANVDNQAKVTPNLPLTGGQGVALLAVLGTGLVALAAWAARRASKASSGDLAA